MPRNVLARRENSCGLGILMLKVIFGLEGSEARIKPSSEWNPNALASLQASPFWKKTWSTFLVATAGGAATRKDAKALIGAPFLPSGTITKMMQCSKPSNFNLWRRIIHPWRIGYLR
jgi:hypothetical protein